MRTIPFQRVISGARKLPVNRQAKGRRLTYLQIANICNYSINQALNSILERATYITLQAPLLQVVAGSSSRDRKEKYFS